MRKILFIFLILQSCTTPKMQVVNSSNPKVLFFLKHSEDSNEVNNTKLKNWIKDLQIRYTNLYFIGKSFNVNSSLSFQEQLKIIVQETKPKYVFSYEYTPAISYSKKNKYVFILSDSTRNIIKDNVYHDWSWIGLSDIARDFLNLESLN